MLNKNVIEEIKTRLKSEKNQIVSKHQADQDIDVDGDETDEIQARLIVSVMKTISSMDKIKIDQINSALKRIDENTFGVCEECEEPIAEKRIKANPSFLTCISCAEMLELQQKRNNK